MTRTKTDKSKWIIIKFPKSLAILTKNELLAALAASPEIFTKAVRRGKIAIRRQKRAERMGTSLGGGPG